MRHDSSRVVIADLPVSDRPRERLASHGATVLSDIELLAILIGTGRPGRSTMDLARRLLADGLRSFAVRGLANSDAVVGPATAARIAAGIEIGRRLAVTAEAGEPIADPTSLAPALIAKYAHRRQECLGAIYLDSRNRVLRDREIYVGTLTSANVSSRDVFRFALEEGAASVVVFHNHPSGDPTPSAEDVAFTRTLVRAGEVMSVSVLDHLIVGVNGFASLKQRGVI